MAMTKDCIITSPEHIRAGNTLISLHVRRGHLAKAQEVCDQLEARDVVSWNVLIAGYNQYRHGEEAVRCFVQMQHEGLLPNAVTFAATLKACGSILAAEKAKEIHAEISKEGLIENNVIVGTALVDTYARCGMLAESQQVFDQLKARNSVSWNVLIARYAQYGCGEEAIQCYEKMQLEGLCPNAVTFLSLLKACGSIRAIEKGVIVHADMHNRGLVGNNVMLDTGLVDMYAKCGAFAKAEEMFHLLHFRNLFGWSILMAGYIQQGQGENALNCFEQMQCEGIFADAVALVCTLKACGMLDILHKGKAIHAVILLQGLIENVLIGTGLLDMYAKCGALAKAQDVFDQLQNRNRVCWTALIAAYTKHGQGEKALKCFEQMQENDFSPDAATFVCILNACGSIRAIEKGKEIHAEIMKGGLLEKCTSVGAALVDMYAKCGAPVKAREVLDKLRVRDVVSWTALIAGYARHGYDKEALNSFQQMQHEGHSPNVLTYVCILKACGNIGATNEGKEMHAEILKEGFLCTNILVGNALVDMYAKFAIPEKAQEVFDQLPVRDVVSWNALISAYVRQGSAEEALNRFWEMQDAGIVPDIATFLCVLKACGNIGCADTGEKIHVNISRDRLLENDALIGTALVDMYVKCGSLAKAHEVFNELMVRDVISWSALITGYAQFGKDEMVIDLLNKMIQEGLKPDFPTFTVVLNAFSHSGLLEKGELIYEALIGGYGTIPTLRHHTCMVDLFSRAGHFDKAVTVLQNMPTSDYLPAWIALLSGCNKWRNVKLGQMAFEHVVRLDERYPATYVCMGNMYAAAAMHEN